MTEEPHLSVNEGRCLAARRYLAAIGKRPTDAAISAKCRLAEKSVQQIRIRLQNRGLWPVSTWTTGRSTKPRKPMTKSQAASDAEAAENLAREREDLAKAIETSNEQVRPRYQGEGTPPPTLKMIVRAYRTEWRRRAQ